jgi:hypothetical protein
MPITGVSHVSPTVTDLDRARGFRIYAMGFESKSNRTGLLIRA